PPADFSAPAGTREPEDFSEPAPSMIDPIDTGAGSGSGGKGGKGGGTHVVTVPIGGGSDDGKGSPSIVFDDEGPRESKRTQSLPGILIGKELVKTIHLYTGEEVQVVSPLSDPSNPDANGTPIPFNRDFRIAGTFFTGMYEYDLKHVSVSLDSLLEFLDRGDAVDGIEVRIENPDDSDAFVAKF